MLRVHLLNVFNIFKNVVNVPHSQTDALLPRSSVHVHAVHPLVLHKKATNQPKQSETSYKTSAQT